MPGTLTKSTLQILAEERLADARALLLVERFSGAYYLGGYAAELGLKACIASAFQTDEIPDRRFVEKIYTHDLARLVSLAELEVDRVTRSVADPEFALNWEVVIEWSENARYMLIDADVARRFMTAMSGENHGVFEWIKTHW